MRRYPQLRKSVRIGNILIDNRLAVAIDASGTADANGIVNNALIQQRMEQAECGAGLFITERLLVQSCCYEPPDDKRPQLKINSDDCLAGIQRYVSAIRAKGARVVLRLGMSGPKETNSAQTQRLLPENDSDADYRFLLLAACFRAAAVRAWKAGADGVELDATTLDREYWLDDSIGLIREIRDAAPVRAVVIRIGLDPFLRTNDGYDDLMDALDALIESGPPDAFHIAAETPAASVAVLSRWTAAIRSAAALPVIASIGIHALDDAEGLITAQAADICATDGSLPKRAFVRRPRSSVYYYCRGAR